MAGFRLSNTLSEQGGVTRGLCRTDATGQLLGVTETYDIIKTEEGAFAGDNALDPDLLVSMNMWGLTPDFFDKLEAGFTAFLAGLGNQTLRAEYLIPIVMNEMVQCGKAKVQVLKTDDKWLGMTYKQDKVIVMEALRDLREQGIYEASLFSDLKFNPHSPPDRAG